MNETTTAAVAVSGSVSEYHIGHTIYRVKTVFNPAFRESLSDISQGSSRLTVRKCSVIMNRNRTSRLCEILAWCVLTFSAMRAKLLS